MTNLRYLTVRGFQTWHLKEPTHEYWVFQPFHIGIGYNLRDKRKIGCFDLTILGVGLTFEWPMGDWSNGTRAKEPADPSQ